MARLGCGRQKSSQVQVSAANKFRIAATRRRRQVQALQLFQNEVINEVAALGLGEDFFGNPVGVGDRDGGDINAAQVPCGDRSLAETDDFKLSKVIHLGNG